ncbi:MAG TPA: TIGR04255 family protein [Candidatus Dormibacteraeota bacterium]|nr:TIGR04255 family protein [Candidatus Dormibacteraeota bacterium]
MGSDLTLASLFTAVPEVPLPAAPLELVVAQVRFNPIMSIASESGFIGPFQEALRQDYPLLRSTLEAGLIVAPDGKPLPQPGQKVWRFEQKEGPWQVTLTSEFVALSTRTYTNRDDFVRRVGLVLEALATTFRPAQAERLGVRYVSRVVEPSFLEDLPELVRPEILGVAGIPAEPNGIRLEHTLTDSLFRMEDDVGVRARWGVLPPRATYDVTLSPSESRSFLLDLDIFSDVARGFSPLALRDMTARYSTLQYHLFRWAVTAEFLRAYGGDIE